MVSFMHLQIFVKKGKHSLICYFAKKKMMPIFTTTTYSHFIPRKLLDMNTVRLVVADNIQVGESSYF
jgi:hypothetical protein